MNLPRHGPAYYLLRLKCILSTDNSRQLRTLKQTLQERSARRPRSALLDFYHSTIHTPEYLYLVACAQVEDCSVCFSLPARFSTRPFLQNTSSQSPLSGTKSKIRSFFPFWPGPTGHATIQFRGTLLRISLLRSVRKVTECSLICAIAEKFSSCDSAWSLYVSFQTRTTSVCADLNLSNILVPGCGTF